MIAIEEAAKGADRNSSAGASEGCGTGSVLQIEQSIAYMAQHLDRPLQVATLAAKAKLSPSHFFALFKRRTGTAPMDYFTRLRMQHACQLLNEASLSVKEVAALMGYDDPFYFSRVFKSVFAVAPVHYRSLDRAMRQQSKEQTHLDEQFLSGDSPRRAKTGRHTASAGQPNPTRQKQTTNSPI